MIRKHLREEHKIKCNKQSMALQDKYRSSFMNYVKVLEKGE